MKFKVKTKDCRLLVKVKTSLRETFDEKELDAFDRMYLRGFLKPKMIKKGTVEYSGPIGLSLYERLKKPISKRDFLFIMEQIVVTVQKIHSNNLSINRLIFDLQYCFINEVTKELQFLYIPTENDQENHGVVAFMESVIYSAIPSDAQDTEFVSRFVYFLKGQKRFDLERVEAFIAKEDRSVVNTIKKQNAGQSGFITSNHSSYYDHYDKKAQELSDENTDLLSEDEATGLLSELDEATGLLYEADDATDLLVEEEEEATGLLSDDATGLLNDDEDGTALLNEPVMARYPSLFRVITEETISINKPVFRIGKERSYVDYFVTNNNAVSRSHADIITRGNRYFVLDLNSKNHTYINEQMIPVQCETEIHNGDRLKLGNEEFIFNT